MNLRALLAALLLSTGLTAQVAAPDFLCTRSEGGGEILSWQNVDNNCGPYQATEIYVATGEAGPYALLTRLNDRSLTEYRDENPNGEQRFYYLQYVYDCPGQEVLRSDTLDSFIPVVPEVNFLSVEDGGLRLSWTASPSPEVSGYVIYEVTAAGIFPLDTVGTVTSYRIDGVPDNELTTRQYRIAAIDPCENDSPQSRIVAATGLSSSGGRGCDSDVVLEKVTSESSTPIGDPLGPDELYVAVNGSPFAQADYDTAATTVVYTAGSDGEQLCFYLLSRFENGDSVLTDTVCTMLDIVQPIRPFATYGLEVRGGGELRFAYDNTASQPRVDEYLLEVRGAAPAGISYVVVSPDFFAEDTLLVNGIAFDAAADVFILSLTDTCGRVTTSNAVRPVILSGEQTQAGSVNLNWTPLENGLPGTTTYDVLRILPDGSTMMIGTVTDGRLVFTDPDIGETGGCYHIRANFTPADRDATYTFISNLTCVEGRTELYLPNVFNPGARLEANRSFRPFFTVPTAVTDYRLLVFDRWGALYFESADPARGWDGTLGGSKAPTGSYIYVLTYRSGQRNLVERTGVVTLIR